MKLSPKEPVYFLSLELQNVGVFGPEPVLIDLSDGQGRHAQWTLILGENGTGKTTALECIFGLSPWRVERFPVRGARVNAQQWTLDSTYERLRRDDSDLPLRLAATIEGDDSAYPANNTNRIEFQIARSADDDGSIGAEALSPFETQEEWPDSPVVSYHASRDIGLYLPGIDESSLDGPGSRPDKSFRVAQTKAVDEWLLDLHHTQLARAREGFEGDFDKVGRLLVNVLPDVEAIQATTPQERGEAVRIEYLTADGWMPFDRLALGYRSIAHLVGDIAYRLYSAYPKSMDPTREAAVVLIDEVDLHLHPTWQRTLVQTLSDRFPNVQFIVTAHSPLMVQAVAGHNLALLYRDSKTSRVRVDNDVDRIANWRLDQIVTSELFGVPSAVRPQLDPDVDRRNALLAKDVLTDADRDEIQRIESALGDVPLGSTPDEQHTNDLLRRTLDALEKKAAG